MLQVRPTCSPHRLLGLPHFCFLCSCITLFFAREAVCLLTSGSGLAGLVSEEDAIVLAQAASLTACPSLRIAVVNGVGHHYEVLTGLLHVLKPYEQRTDVFVYKYIRLPNGGDGIWDIMANFNYTYRLVDEITMISLAESRPVYDLVILVSPEGELTLIAEMMLHIKHRLTIAYVHNSDFRGMSRLINIVESTGGVLKLVGLAPHSASSLSQAVGRPVDWVLAANPHNPKTDCLHVPEAELLGICLRGFTIQGKLSSSRRNYSAIWAQMVRREKELAEQPVASRFHINVLGKGEDNVVTLPSSLLPMVSLLKQLAFKDFYDAIHHSYALLPAFGSSHYYTTKFSSTILSALITGTPMVVNRRFLDTYAMFSEQSVYLQADGEQELDVMLRVMRMPAAEVVKARRGLLEVRNQMNSRAAEFFANALREVCASASASRALA